MTVKRILSLFLLLALTSLAAGAQTVDEILEKHAAAHGGVEKWRAVKSLVITGTQVIFSESSPFVYEWRRPDSSRFEQSMLGRKITYVHDGATTWWIHPLLVGDEPAAVPAEAAAAVRRAADFESPLVDAKAKGHKVELLGKDAVDGQPALKLKVTRKDGTEETWYLDPDTYLELARFDRTIDLPQTHDRWTWFSDFRTVGGLVIPHQQEQEYSIRNVSVKIEKVQVNPEIDSGRFTMPVVEKPAEEKKPAEGA